MAFVQLVKVLRFMRHKSDQVSGLKGGLTPDVIYDRFTEALRREVPEVSAAALLAMEQSPQSAHKESLWDKVVSNGSQESEKEASGFSFGFEVDDEDMEEE